MLVELAFCVQGVAEVVGGLGVEKLHTIMPDLISTANDPNLLPAQKDGCGIRTRNLFSFGADV